MDNHSYNNAHGNDGQYICEILQLYGKVDIMGGDNNCVIGGLR